MIKKINSISLALLLLMGMALTLPATAQEKTDERTTETRIADLLAQLPAQDATQLNRNMKEVAALGEDGYVALITGLAAPGKESNALAEYAISGFTAYVTKPGMEAMRNMAINAYCKALAKVSDNKNKAFLISQFDLIGNDAAVAYLAPYLGNVQLVDETSRALIKIGSPAAIQALTSAIPKANVPLKTSIVAALAHSHATVATTAIIPLLSDSNPDLVKASLYTLAQIGDATTGDLLLKAAAARGFTYDPTNAMAALLIYASKNVHTDKAGTEKIAKTILEKATAGNQVNARIAALGLLSAVNPDSKVLLAAMKDKSPALRAAAIKLAAPGIDDARSGDWIKQLKKADASTQVAILDMLAQSKASSAWLATLKFVKSSDSTVKRAAINATVKLGESDALVPLLKLMNKGTMNDIAEITSGLQRMKGKNVSAMVASHLSQAEPGVQEALIGFLATRAATPQIEVVYAALQSPNPGVRRAAFSALQHLAVAANRPQLFDLLNTTTDASELTAVQAAIIASINETADNDATADNLIAQMKSAPAAKKVLFYKILAKLGGRKPLNAVVSAYASGDDTTKKAVLEALSVWADNGACSELIKIARNTTHPDYLNRAINGYLLLLRKNSYPAEQRLLLLRNAMDLAKTPAQQQLILKDAEQAKCFNAIVFAGRYLDNPALQQAAANAVMNITMSGQYHGDIVKNLLNKTIAVISGSDASYQREGMRKYISAMKPGEGFVQAFNGKDLTGWKGLVGNPITRAKMDSVSLATAQVKADAQARESWKIINGELQFQSHGDNLATVKKYGDFEMLVDWKIIDDKKGEGDAGIYLRGTPQVQIWDLARTNVGAQVGSGGLYNNQHNESKPLLVADNKLDEWNTFRILMKGDRVTVYLNGQLVTDNVILENYWDRSLPIFAEEQIELQAHGSPVAYRDIYIREIERPKPFELSAEEQKEGYKVLFDGTNMYNWTGNTSDYVIENGNIAIRPKPGKGSGGNLYTKEEYSDFIFRFEFQLTPGANNGLGIRAPLSGDAAYVGMELQILDSEASIYKDLKPYQYHGSVYGTIPAKRGFLKPVGEWNYQEVVAKGDKIKVTLNGTVILDGDIGPFKKNGTPDHQQHPGLQRTTGHIGFLGHGSPLQFRNIRIKDLSVKENSNPIRKKK